MAPRLETVSERQLFSDEEEQASYRRQYDPWLQGYRTTRSENDVMSSNEPSSEQGYRIPLCAIDEGVETITLEIELPGVGPDQIDIFVGADIVEVTTDPGNTEAEADASRRYYGSMALPAEIDADRTESSWANGVLTLKLQKQLPPPLKRFKVSGPKAAAKK